MKITVFIISVLLAAFAVQAGGKNVTYKAEGRTYQGYFISPSAKAPLVLLVHDWDGLTDYEMKRSGMLAELGYAVFAVDLFGAGVRPESIEDKKKLTGELYKDRGKMRSLLRAGLKAAKSKGANTGNAVAMGYCFGGSAVLELARSGEDLKGFVAFHGGLEIPRGQDYAKTKGRLLILHGSADQHVTLEHFAALASHLEEKKVPHEMITYSGAPHAFTVFGSDRYREEADKSSWARFKRFLKETLGSSLR